MSMTRGITAGLALSLLLSAVPAAALAPDASLRPEPRPGSAAAAAMPAPREILSTSGVLRSPRPEARPKGLRGGSVIRAAAVRTQPAPPAISGRKGAVCGLNDIKGVTLAPIAGRLAGCGLEDGVRVESIAGVALTQRSVMDCRTALALRTWVRDAVIPTVGRTGGGVAALRVAAHYSCRTRNNQKGAKISEHGKGRAIDISSIVLRNGAEITVLEGWRDARQGPILKTVHRAACGPFGTVLGPNANRFHQDHFHFDTARYRSGPFCR